MPRKARRNQRSKRLDVSAVGVLPTHVPKRWVKFLVGLFLLPPAFVLTQTFFTAFARTTVHDAFWATEEFWFFALGVVLWLVTFFGLPRPLWFYVFGHELTHAVWVMLMGGRVHKFHVTRDGGHILADRTNTMIALAPYFFPIYSLLVIALYGVLGFFFDMAPFHRVLYAAIGFTWGFHMCFTIWMIPKGQPDLHYGGTFFSVMVIYLLNLCLLAVLLIIASRKVTAWGFAHDLLQNSVNLTGQAVHLFRQMIR